MARRRDIDRLQHEVEELFADLWQVPRYVGSRRAFRPDVDCYSTDDPPALTIVVDLAGVDPADLQIHATPRELRVQGARRRPRIPGSVYHQAELEYGRFEREIRLPAPADVAAASATFENGLLTIVLPLAARAPRKVAVAVELRVE